MAPGKLIDLSSHRAIRRKRRSTPQPTPNNVLAFVAPSRTERAESFRAQSAVDGAEPVEVKSQMEPTLAPIVQLRRAVDTRDYKVDALELAEILFDTIFDEEPDPDPPLCG